MVQVDPEKISLVNIQTGTQIEHLLEKNIAFLRYNVMNFDGKLANSGGLEMRIQCIGYDDTNNIKLTLDTDESYSLTVTQLDKSVSLLILLYFSLFSFSDKISRRYIYRYWIN